MRFRHEIIDADPPGSRHDIVLLHDINGNGKLDIVIGGKLGDVNLFWYENPSWRRHDMALSPNLEAGGLMVDITGNGLTDIVAGQSGEKNRNRELTWFERPDDPTQTWTRRLILDCFSKYHDQAVADIDGDGALEIVFHSQRAGILGYLDIPDDPRVEPWPDECIHVVAEGLDNLEGLVIEDIDGDGKLEVVAGGVIFRPGDDPASGRWEQVCFAPDYVMARVAIGDLTGDGRPDMVIAEGESNPGRLAWCSGPDWRPVVLRDDLFHPHSVAIADLNGDGQNDIFVGEMGLGKNPDPKMIVYINRGGGDFEECVISRGRPTHEAKLGDLTGDGRLDIVGKPYQPDGGVIEVWYNEGE